MRRLGFIGLGAMGFPMCRRLVEAGYPTAVFDLRPDVVASAVRLGAEAKESAAAVAAAAGVVLTCVPRHSDVEAIFFGAGGIAEAIGDGRRRILIDLSSSKAATSRRIAEAMRRAGGDFLDAPISGGVARAETGELAIIVGGDPATYDSCLDIFKVIGSNIFRVGEVGVGNLAKALNNILSTTNVMIVAEALLAGARAGLDPSALAKAAGRTLAQSYAVERRVLGEVLTGRFGSRFRMGLMYKDLTYAVELAAEARVPALVVGLGHDLAAAATDALGEEADYTRVANLVERWATGGSELFGPP
ncbi:MAG: NAD(P)-dependent oxidoreductase [Proteobacteria bacterium]|nr:NAD(P)-dependent oxidoreductase [Pseudomonadota bacterium]